MRKLKALLTSLTILLVLCAPAVAQSASPAANQYAGASAAKRCPDGGATAAQESQVQADVGDGACASAENAGQGTDAVNDALTGTASSASPSAAEALAPDGPSASASADSGASGDNASAGEGQVDDGVSASITELPDTGGIPLTPLGIGVALVASGLAARGVVGR